MDRVYRDAGQELLVELQERAKELNCLYEVEELLRHYEAPLADTLTAVARALGLGMRYPGLAHARIEHDDETYLADDLEPTPWTIAADILVHDNPVGRVRTSTISASPI